MANTVSNKPNPFVSPRSPGDTVRFSSTSSPLHQIQLTPSACTEITRHGKLRISTSPDLAGSSTAANPLLALNYLAHLHLAENTAASRVGNLLGDFVPGRPESLRDRFPPAVIDGIVRHRAIDRFTDVHPVTLRLKAYLSPKRRRFAGAITDIIQDYFLTRRWDEFSSQPFADFIEACHTALREHLEYLPAELGDTLEERINERWLEHYGSDDGLDMVFQRVARRSPSFAPIHSAIEDFRQHRETYAAGFQEFYPDLQKWVLDLGPEAQAI